ncbi:helix-turn-helix domain-containing protein [Limosilactobacillus mucosae]|uniref:helix-turn-helix domain-containing protein n=1 Tax=Limosilactobacillus mucosae TaxID=97478 RepID=UPI00233EBA86|nr:helix-turn-helix domain-containing protein [Limosilactobacillus mucosae]MDC2845534.1 helix-turn-helix domain-containing protein [Limosilactobacillus mucosae]
MSKSQRTISTTASIGYFIISLILNAFGNVLTLETSSHIHPAILGSAYWTAAEADLGHAVLGNNSWVLFWAFFLLGVLNDPYPQSWKYNFGGIFMTKISIETKIKVIEEYCTTTGSLRGITRKYGIAKLDFQICVGIYARFGKEKLLNPTTATGDFRLNPVKWKQQKLASIPETCIHFGFRSPGSVYRWECQYNKQGAQALLKLRPGRKLKHELKEKEIQRLKKQNQLLPKENLSLKIQLDASKS